MLGFNITFSPNIKTSSWSNFQIALLHSFWLCDQCMLICKLIKFLLMFTLRLLNQWSSVAFIHLFFCLSVCPSLTLSKNYYIFASLMLGFNITFSPNIKTSSWSNFQIALLHSFWLCDQCMLICKLIKFLLMFTLRLLNQWSSVAFIHLFFCLSVCLSIFNTDFLEMCHYIVLIFCIESEDLKSIKLTEPNFLEKFILYLTWAIFVENGKILRSVIVEKKKKNLLCRKWSELENVGY